MDAVKLPIIADDITEQVLLRLPVKSLLKFRCVSKSWCSLISSKHFIKTHLEYSTNDPYFRRHSVIPTYLRFADGPKKCSLHSLLYKQHTITDDFVHPLTSDNVDVVGSCNGLCCISTKGKEIFLWNPSTRKYKKLPDVDCNPQKFDIENYGFGFEESNDDYKIVVVIGLRYESWFEHVVKVYSLKANSWKSIEDFEKPYGLVEFAKFANGKLHWLWVDDDCCNETIVSFDLESEVQGILEQPTVEEGLPRSTLGVLGGCLCVLYTDLTRLDLWVMREYGVKDSWDKIVSIRHGLPLMCRDNPPTAVCVSKEGKILIFENSKFRIFAPESKSFIQSFATRFVERYTVDIYIESLVAPFS